MFHLPGGVSDPAWGVAAKAFSVNYLKALYDKPGIWKRLRNFDADVSAFGESVTIPSFPRLTAQTVSTTTGAYTYDATAIVPQTILINKPNVVPYSVPDMVLHQAKMDVDAAFAEESGRAVSDSIDHEVVKLISSFTTNTAGSIGGDLTDAFLCDALGKMVANHVDMSNPMDFVWVLPASQYSPTRQLKSYETYRMTPSQSNSEGGNDITPALDTLHGIPVHFRSDSEMTVSGGKEGGLFYRDSIGVAIQRMPAMLPKQLIPGTVNWQYVCYALFGIAVIKEPVGVRVLCR
jgi:hypothetical protein